MSCLAVCIALVVAVSSAARESQPGRIEGKVTDKRCGTLVPYSSVILIGTNMGGMTDKDGRFAIVDVPPGKYDVRVMSLGHEMVEVRGVRLKAGATARQDFKVDRRGRNTRTADERSGPGECEVHHRTMGSILVPIGYGLKVVDREYESAREAGFPNAEPEFSAGCVISDGDPVKATVYRCPECVIARNEYKECGAWDRATPSQRELKRHKLAGTIEFAAPHDMKTKRVREACQNAMTLTADSMMVRVTAGEWSIVAREFPRKVGFDTVIVQDGVAGGIALIEAEDGVEVFVKFWVTPVDSDAVIMRIQAKGDDALSLAKAIVRSVRFSTS